MYQKGLRKGPLLCDVEAMCRQLSSRRIRKTRAPSPWFEHTFGLGSWSCDPQIQDLVKLEVTAGPKKECNRGWTSGMKIELSHSIWENSRFSSQIYTMISNDSRGFEHKCNIFPTKTLASTIVFSPKFDYFTYKVLCFRQYTFSPTIYFCTTLFH